MNDFIPEPTEEEPQGYEIWAKAPYLELTDQPITREMLLILFRPKGSHKRSASAWNGRKRQRTAFVGVWRGV